VRKGRLRKECDQSSASDEAVKENEKSKGIERSDLEIGRAGAQISRARDYLRE
jgi:hypothetical protein